MRHSEFRELVDEVFGASYAPVLIRELALTNLRSLTCEQALQAGEDPRDVWHALADQMDLTDTQRFGIDEKRNVPPRRG